MNAFMQMSTWVQEILRNPAVKGRRLRALARAGKWQVAKRLGVRRALVNIGPAQLYCYPGHPVASGALYTGFMEWNEMTFAIRFLRPGDHFVDVGANVGTYSVYASTFLQGVKVVAIEPGDEARQRLLENLALNELTSVRVIGKVIGEKEGLVPFSKGRDALNAIDPGSLTNVEELPMTTLDHIVGDEEVDLLKIDIEGAELRALEGARTLLSADPAPTIIIEVNGLSKRYKIAPDDVYRFLESLGYLLFEYDGITNALTPFTGARLPRSGNVIACKHAAAVRERLLRPHCAANLHAIPIRLSLER